MDTNNPLLGPVIALVAWSLVVLTWMALTRLPALKKAGIDINARRGGRGQNLEGVLPDEVNWKAHNYSHLMEQPTIFYPIVLTLVLLGDRVVINLWLAWAYVAIRIIHSVWQATVNIVRVRLVLFGLSTLCLIALTLHAALTLLALHH